MASLRKMTTGALAAAILITSASPAFARRGYGYGHGGYGYGYGGYGGYGRGWHGHHNHIDTGDVIAGVAIVGILAAVLSSASRAKNQTTTSPTSYPQQSGKISSEEAAVDACAMATEAQAGQRASVRDISQVDRNADGWDVEGVVEQRTAWQNNSETDRRRFTCKVRYGAVADVYIASEVASLN